MELTSKKKSRGPHSCSEGAAEIDAKICIFWSVFKNRSTECVTNGDDCVEKVFKKLKNKRNVFEKFFGFVLLPSPVEVEHPSYLWIFQHLSLSS